MYKLHLILKYLRKRRIAWVSLIAVMLCTTMVLVVISVMGGWLRMFRQSFNNIGGDIVVQGRSLVGFPHYQEMMDRINRLPEVKATAPLVRALGLVNIGNQIRKGVEVIGYPPEIGEVNGFADSLHLRKGRKPVDFSLIRDMEYYPPPGYRGRDVRSWDGMIVGTGVVGLQKDRSGKIYRPSVMYRLPVDLTLLPISPDSSRIDIKETKRNFYWIVDDSNTGVFILDSNTVYVPFDTLQRDLEMSAGDDSPARASEIQVALRPGAKLEEVRDKIEAIVWQVREEKQIDARFPIMVRTWEDIHATFIGAVEKEKVLVTVLFAIISIVAIFLIFCIFYMIVVEKTRDIGIVKSVGATSMGVAGIFLGYGLVIGVLGAGLGLLAGWLIVHYINQIHEAIGYYMGVQVWNPEIYLFDKIPNTMNPHEVVLIVSVAIVASVLGALVPAIRAATLHPVEALRWE